MTSDEAGARPRLLFLCHTLPFPPDGGIWIRSYNVLRLLARTFEVHALCFQRTDGSTPEQIARAVRELSAYATVETFPVPQADSRARLFWDHLRSLLTGRVYTRFRMESGDFRARLAKLVKQSRFDLVHVDSLDLAGYLDLLRGIPTICSHPDVQSVLLRRRSKFERSVAMRWYTRHQAALMGREERAYTPRVALNVMVSEEDSALLRSIAPDAPCVVVPNGVDVDEYAPTDEEGDSIAFVGGTTWFPNLDALDYFCADILPRLRRLGVRAPVRWIGSASVDQQRSYRERYGVQLTGYLDDARPAMREAFCHVVPLRAGGGTRLKILNAWALGKPVVSTSVGCEGLRAVDGENILIRDDADGFARAIADLQSDLGLRAKLRAGARQTVDSHFAWDVIGRGMTRAYLRLIDRSETTERSRP